jgi:hypothetical protein
LLWGLGSVREDNIEVVVEGETDWNRDLESAQVSNMPPLDGWMLVKLAVVPFFFLTW